MRLLHTSRLRFEEFFDDKIPAYAILSHRWEDDEVSYQDFMTGKKQDGAGYAKIMAFCELVAAGPIISRQGRRDRRERFAWAWIDTCCIDKSSSAELSEAINSMYSWYANSSACYAYLSDVQMHTEPGKTMKAFEKSQWFDRGWTLQELLAPSRMSFFGRDWMCIGTRDSLRHNLAAATGISQEFIVRFSRMPVSAAEKLSWIAMRTTSRTEDQAYCMLGLFGINMPLLYGEGMNAFRRFQLELLRSTNDESIFTWDIPTSALPRGEQWEQDPSAVVGLLARDIRDFAPLQSRRYKHDDDYWAGRVAGLSRPPYTITNQGLEIRVPKKLASKYEFFLPLNYRIFKDHRSIGVYAILLQEYSDHWFRGWHRCMYSTLPKRLQKLPAVEYEDGPSAGLFIAPESWLWSREQLAEMETELIYVRL